MPPKRPTPPTPPIVSLDGGRFAPIVAADGFTEHGMVCSACRTIGRVRLSDRRCIDCAAGEAP